MKLFQSLGIISMVLITSFVPEQVLAGSKITEPVIISFFNKTASGSMGNARNSLNVPDYIGCSVHSNAMNGINQIVCSAMNSSVGSVTCTSTSPFLLEAIQAINSDSFIKFTWGDRSTCTSISIYNYSYYEPKQP